MVLFLTIFHILNESLFLVNGLAFQIFPLNSHFCFCCSINMTQRQIFAPATVPRTNFDMPNMLGWSNKSKNVIVVEKL